MRIASWAQRHARSILFLVIVLALGGVLGSFRLPVALFPHVNFPRVEVSLDAGDRPAERMATEVTYPLEQVLRAIPGVRSVRSTTSRGSAAISVNFDWGADMVSAMLQAQSQVNRILPSLPAGTTFDIRRMDPTVFPSLAYSIISDTHSLTQLHDIAMYDLRPALSTVTGVASIGVQGGAAEEYRVVVDVAKLQSYGMTLSDVATSLTAANVLTAVGRLEDHGKLYLVISDTRFKTIDEIGETVLRSGPGGVVLISNIATVQKDAVPAFVRVTADGHDAVLFQIYQQPAGNTVQIARDIKQKLAEIQKGLPQDIKIANWYDQSELILSSAASVRDAVLIGVALAALVLLVFLRNWKITLIAMVAVPAVLAITVLVLYSLHMSFNIMTLGGMAAAVGLIIDDAIVMVEQIVRRLRVGQGDASSRVQHAADEFTKPLTGSSLSTIIIHIPPAFMVGVAGAFFAELSLTMAVSLVISYLIAWVAIPAIAARVLNAKDADQKEEGLVTEKLHRRYGGLMAVLLARPWLALILVAPFLIAGYLCYRSLGTGFMPSMDEGGFILDYKAPPGTSLTETDRLLRQLETILRDTKEVDTYSRRTGLQLGGGLTESNTGDFFIRLKGWPRRDIDEIMQEVRERVESTVPGLEIETAQLMEDEIGDLTAVPQPIEVKLFSDDAKLLQDTAPKIEEAIKKVTGVQEVKGIVFAGDALNIEVDRVKAALEGMDTESITKAVNLAMSGSVTSQIQSGPKLIGVRVWTGQHVRATQRNLEDLQIRSAAGRSFPLKRVATISPVVGQPEITREDLKRMVAVTARIEGRDLGSTVTDVNNVLAQSGLIPPGMTYKLGGLAEEQRIAFKGLLAVIAAAGMLVFVLLLFLYERFRVAIAIVLTMILALAGVFVGLWITGTQLNITSIMGMVMIVGNVAEVAIFYYSEYEDLADGPIAARLIHAGTRRMRAIAMTSIAAILALLPLALGIGHGSAMLQPLAIAIVTGLVIQLPLILIVFPAILVMLGAARGRKESAPV